MKANDYPDHAEEQEGGAGAGEEPPAAVGLVRGGGGDLHDPFEEDRVCALGNTLPPTGLGSVAEHRVATGVFVEQQRVPHEQCVVRGAYLVADAVCGIIGKTKGALFAKRKVHEKFKT